MIDGLSSPCIAKWDGTKWSGLGTGMTGWFGESPAVYALAVYDAGDGPKLYAGGFYHKAGGIAAADIAYWDGTMWSRLVEPGVWGGDHPVRTMVPWDDGSGPSLFVGGDLQQAGGVKTCGIARYDGQTWHDVGGGLSGGYLDIYALRSFDDGRGPALYAGGHFDHAGDRPIWGLARWDGQSWSQVGPGIGGTPYSLAVYDPPGVDGPGFYIGGIVLGGDRGLQGITRWDGQAFSNLGHGEGGAGDLYTGVRAAIEWNDGTGAALYVGGDFWAIGTTAATGVARWNGMRWEAATKGLAPRPGYASAQAFAIFDDGLGRKLYATGLFYEPNEGMFSRLVRWNGIEDGWTCLDHSPNHAVGESLIVWDDGSGPALYVCGSFTDVGGVPANHIARWDGQTWSALGSGLEDGKAVPKALAVFDDGRGPALYVGGGYITTAGGVPVRNLARWDGKTWSDVGGGINNWCFAMLSVERDESKSLLVGGAFTQAGTLPARGIAAWDGYEWRDISGGLKAPQKVIVEALCAFDDGAGPAIYAAGTFTEPGRCFARWDGQRWTGVAAGGVYAQTLAPSYSVQGPSLFAGGRFNLAGERASVHVAQWRCVPGWKPGDMNCDTAVNFADINPFVLALLDKSRYQAEFPNCLWVNADCNGDGAVNFADINPFVGLLKQ